MGYGNIIEQTYDNGEKIGVLAYGRAIMLGFLWEMANTIHSWSSTEDVEAELTPRNRI